MNIGWIDNDFDYNEAIALSENAKAHKVILLPKIFKDSFTDFTTDYKIWYGSRVSAKTYAKAIEFLYKAYSKPYFRGLFARQTAKDSRESQYQLFEDLILRIYPFLQDYFICETSKMRITCIKNNNFMKGASFENMPRSLAEYTDFWVDEPITRKGSITQNDLLDISGTLRNSYGIKTQKHLTFNPISINTFIYKSFFEDKKFNANILLANYNDNVFCPPEKITELEWYKDVDYQRYLVDSLGYWGNPSVENPFITTFQREKHVSKTPIEYNSRLITVVSVDFNVSPMTALVIQYDMYFRVINIIDEFRDLNSDVYKLCEWIKNNYDTRTILITGDASGNNRHAYSKDSQSGYQIIKSELRLGAGQFKIPSKKKNYINDKRLITNAFFTKKPVLLSNVPYLIEDLETVTVNSEGKMEKTKDGTKSHLLDCLCDAFYMILGGNVNKLK
jgi:PBSX family phage terminase large subunit